MRQFFGYLGLNYSDLEIDVFTVVSLVYLTILRAVTSSSVLKLSKGIGIFCLVLIVLIFCLYGVSTSVIPKYVAAMQILTFVGALTSCGMLIYREDKIAFVRGYSLLVLTIFIVLILGAINAGLQKTIV